MLKFNFYKIINKTYSHIDCIETAAKAVSMTTDKDEVDDAFINEVLAFARALYRYEPAYNAVKSFIESQRHLKGE